MSGQAKTKLYLIGGILATVGVVLVVFVVSSGGPRAVSPVQESPPVSAHPQPSGADGMRTLSVSSDQMPTPSQPGEALHARRISGEIPTSEIVGTVVSDENCEPDENGVSHCLNRIELPGKRMLVVRHPHDMTVVPCLYPGERIIVRAA